MIQRVARAMESFAPIQLAGSWDNVGILLDAPFPNPKANKIFLTIDLTRKVLEEALSDELVGVIVSYHPPLFSSFKRLVMTDEKQAIALICAARGISIYSPHTALDSCLGGINSWLASGLGEGTTTPITPNLRPPPGQTGCGEGAIHVLSKPISLDTITQRIKDHLGLIHVRRAAVEGKMIGSIAICAGSGGSMLPSAKVGGVAPDLWLTGEMSHHEVLAANANGSSVILTEHSNSERGYLGVLMHRLDKAVNEDKSLPRISIVISSLDKDPLQIC